MEVKLKWNFFVIGPGKLFWDGFGGRLKRLAVRASLQRSAENQILTPTDLFKVFYDTVVEWNLFSRYMKTLNNFVIEIGGDTYYYLQIYSA